MNRIVTYTLILFFACFIEMNSQSVGVGYGFSGTQNFGSPESSIHLSVSINLNERVIGNLSMSNWSGLDGNLQFNNISGTYFGNVGIGLSFLYKYHNTKDFEYYAGFGVNQFEKIHKYSGLKYFLFEPAISITPLFIKYNLNNVFSLFTNGTINFSTEDLNPNWGSIVIGVYFNPINLF
ncbi:MAG: hypothetical protein AB1394_04250 [Bacteroidota bacterium]